MTEEFDYGGFSPWEFCDNCGGYQGDLHRHDCGHPLAISQEGRCAYCDSYPDENVNCSCGEV